MHVAICAASALTAREPTQLDASDDDDDREQGCEHHRAAL